MVPYLLSLDWNLDLDFNFKPLTLLGEGHPAALRV